MKKTILILAMILVIAAVAVVCVSCAKKEEKAGTMEMVSFTVVNNTGKNVTEVVLDDKKSENKFTAKPQGVWDDGSIISFSMQAVIEDNAPDLMFTYTVEGGDSMTAPITKPNATITMVTNDDGLSFDLSDPAK